MSLEKQMLKIGKDMNTIDKCGSCEVIKKYSSIKKKINKCNKYIDEYSNKISNGSHEKPNISPVDIEDEDEDNDKFDNYICRLRKIREEISNDDMLLGDKINYLLESNAIVEWCREYLKENKMNVINIE